MDTIYLLESALVIARREKRMFLVYLITMAIIEAGGSFEPPPHNDNEKN
jgi:hypothetical protein